MKRKFIFLTVLTVVAACTCGFSSRARAQNSGSAWIDVTLRKTSSIVFPVDIRTGDRGSSDILVQKAKGARNVLNVKAGKKNFPETNLTVITEDGGLHHFLVRFSDSPKKHIFYADSLEGRLASPPVHLAQIDLYDMKRVSRAILSRNSETKIAHTKRHQMAMQLKGIYIDGQTMYYHLQIDNKSNIPYDVEMLQFLVRDKQKVKRMAAQESVETPLFVHGDPTAIPGPGVIDLVYALSKFTIPDAKNLVIQLLEKTGGRHLEMRVRNKAIVGARKVYLK